MNGTGISSITIRRAPTGHVITYILGPGGVGKSTLGKALAGVVERKLIDLDHVFCELIGDIGDFIRIEGYTRYKIENSLLADTLASSVNEPTIFVTSSGFLSMDNPPEVRRKNLELVSIGYSLTLLPSDNIDEAAPIVVERLIARRFDSDRGKAERIFRERFDLYRVLGDVLVISTAPQLKRQEPSATRWGGILVQLVKIVSYPSVPSTSLSGREDCRAGR